MLFPCPDVSMYVLPRVVVLESRLVSNQRITTGQCCCHSLGPLLLKEINRKVSNIRHTLAGNKIVDHSDVVGASPVGAAPTTSSFST